MRMMPAVVGRGSRRMPAADVTDSVQIPRDLYSLKAQAVLPFDEQRLSIAEAPVGAPTSICEAPMPVGDAAPVLSDPDTFDDQELPMMNAPVGATAVVPEEPLREMEATAEAPLDFSDPDTFDTFGSLNQSDNEGGCPDESFAEFETPEKNDGALPGLDPPPINDQPTFPDIKPFLAPTARRAQDQEEEDDGDVYDMPQGMMAGPGGGRALRELQCASVKAGNELAAQVRELESKQRAARESAPQQKISRAQGGLQLRSRFLRRWNTRYASIVDHAYFGSVLFLFQHEGRAKRDGTVALKASKMVVLADSTVRELEVLRKTGPSFFFELKTAQRKYVFACVDEEQRQYWLENLSSFTAP